MKIRNNILCLCVFATAFSSSRVFAESTEAGSICLDGALCTQNNNSALPRLVESIPENQCPKFTLRQQILRDQQGNLLSSSPDEICLKNSDSFIRTFENARELESYIQENPYFSNLNKGAAFSSCLSQGVSIPMGTGPTASEQTRILPENKQKLAVAEYYSSLRRISDGAARSLQNIAAIDVMIEEPVLSGVSCSGLENIVSRDIQNRCQSFKQCSSSGVSSGLRTSAQDTLLALQAIEAMNQEIRRLKGPRARTYKKNKDKIQELEERKQNIQNLYPWMLGKVFKDGYNPSDYSNYSQESKKEALEDQMAALIKNQLTYTRDKLKERKEDFLKASLCIKGDESLCEDLDVPKILAKAPPINHNDVFDSKNKIKELEEKSKEGQLSAQEITEERQNIRKAAASEYLFGSAECLQLQRTEVKEVNEELALGALDVGVVMLTMGMGSAAVAGRIALRVGGALSKAQKASKARRLQNLGIFGTDAGLSIPYIKEAMSVCEDVMNQLEQTASEETTNNICEKLPVKAQHTSDLKSCILQASLASLPITLPLLGLSGISLARKIKRTNSPVTNISTGSPGGVKGPPPKELWDTTDPRLSKGHVKIREAHNRGFFTEDERYIFLFGDRARRIKSFDEEDFVLEKVDSRNGNITEEAWPISSFSDSKANPAAVNFFKSLESRLAAVEPVQYPSFNKEAQMLKKGMKKEMSQGLDEAYKMNHFADYLRKSNIHPYNTHIEDFSDQIPEHIRFIREGFKGRKDAAERAKLLDHLALEASKKQKEKGVTYAWWLQWNHKLTSLLNERLHNSLIEGSFDTRLIQGFPDFVVLPTFEDLGVMAINRFVSENVFPLSIVDKPTFADARILGPSEFFRHDEEHARVIIDNRSKSEGRLPYGEKSFMDNKEFYEKIQDLPADQQTQAETVYFLITHENGKFYDNVSESFGHAEYFLFRRDESLLRLLPENIRHSEEEIISYLKKAQYIYRKLLRESKEVSSSNSGPRFRGGDMYARVTAYCLSCESRNPVSETEADS